MSIAPPRFLSFAVCSGCEGIALGRCPSAIQPTDGQPLFWKHFSFSRPTSNRRHLPAGIGKMLPINRPALLPHSWGAAAKS